MKKKKKTKGHLIVVNIIYQRPKKTDSNWKDAFMQVMLRKPKQLMYTQSKSDFSNLFRSHSITHVIL